MVRSRPRSRASAASGGKKKAAGRRAAAAGSAAPSDSACRPALRAAGMGALRRSCARRRRGPRAPGSPPRSASPARASANLHFALAGVPPPVPGSRRDGHLLSRLEGAFLSVEDEVDPPRPDLEVLGAVVVHVLATGDEAARLDGEVGPQSATPSRGSVRDRRMQDESRPAGRHLRSRSRSRFRRPPQARTLYGTTSDGKLVTFTDRQTKVKIKAKKPKPRPDGPRRQADQGRPGDSTRTIFGLPAGVRIVGIDIRPSHR